jgi:hypothetical protein
VNEIFPIPKVIVQISMKRIQCRAQNNDFLDKTKDVIALIIIHVNQGIDNIPFIGLSNKIEMGSLFHRLINDYCDG